MNQPCVKRQYVSTTGKQITGGAWLISWFSSPIFIATTTRQNCAANPIPPKPRCKPSSGARSIPTASFTPMAGVAMFEPFVARHAGAHQCRFACCVHAMHGEDVLGQIDAYGYDGHGLALPQNEWVDERLDFPSWRFVGVSRNGAGHSGRGSPFYSLAT